MSSFSISELLTSTGPVLITDQLSSPGDFLLHQLLSEYVKSSPDGKCIIISTSQDLARWKAISSRSGLNMAQKLEQGSIVFIDVPTQLPDLSPSKGTLLPLLDLIRRYIETRRGTTPTLLIFDELALFEWIGHSELDVSRFARALVSSSVKNDVSLVIRYHIAAPTTSTTLCGYWSNSPHTISKSSHFPAGRVVPSVVRSRCTQARYTLSPPAGSYHAPVRCSIAWESTTQRILSAEQGMRCCEDIKIPRLIIVKCTL
ncbi:hypothetical protein BGY98DRAFT_383154 [Russula aff. rugulosa BPL654]|nr:hypothetical protein BGY98DRAFT_383154 [Russula aff. rugulosa BPL654]